MVLCQSLPPRPGGCGRLIGDRFRPEADFGQCISRWTAEPRTWRLHASQIVGTNIYDVDLADILRHLCAKQAASMGIECGLECA